MRPTAKIIAFLSSLHVLTIGKVQGRNYWTCLVAPWRGGWEEEVGIQVLVSSTFGCCCWCAVSSSAPDDLFGEGKGRGGGEVRDGRLQRQELCRHPLRNRAKEKKAGVSLKLWVFVVFFLAFSCAVYCFWRSSAQLPKSQLMSGLGLSRLDQCQDTKPHTLK